MNLRPIQSITLTEAVYKELLHSIISAKIRPGEKLKLEQLAKELDVSIMPVREAIRKLEAGKFVSLQKNRRIVVSQLSSKREVDQILELRLILECLAIRKACKKFTRERLGELELLQKKIVETRDAYAALELNTQFHFLIYEQAQIPILTEVINLLWKKISPYLHMEVAVLFRKFDGSIPHNIFYCHDHIIEKIGVKDEEQAAKWLKRDVNTGIEYLGIR